jgi:SAM-dependent methyltransferase
MAGDAERLLTPLRRASLDVAASLEPDPRSLLDIGCGSGALLRLAAGHFPAARRAGIDSSEDAILHADGAGAELVQACAERIPFADRTFDVVISVLRYHCWADHEDGLREIARVLAPGGALVLADRTVPERVESLVAGAGLVVDDVVPVLSVGPLVIVNAVTARRPITYGGWTGCGRRSGRQLGSVRWVGAGARAGACGDEARERGRFHS